MVEVLIELFICLSAIIEVGLVLFFYFVMFKVERIKIYDPIVLGILVYSFHWINAPFIRQILYLGLIVIYVMFAIGKVSFKTAIKGLLLSFIYMLICEVVFSMFCEFVFNLDFANMTQFDRLLVLLPLRLVQYTILVMIWRKNNWESSGLGLSKNTKKKLKKLNS